MPQYNALYGELLTSREVSDLTGYTMNQLRNYRLPERLDKSPFPFLRIGGATYYRKADINAWVEEHGGVEAQYVVMPHHKATPLEVSDITAEKKAVLDKLQTITTENSFDSMATWAIERSGLPNGTRTIHDEGRRLLAIERGIEDWKTIPIPAVTMKETDQEAFWKIWTYGVRRAYVLANQLDVTDEELMRLPIGDVPPLRTK